MCWDFMRVTDRMWPRTGIGPENGYIPLFSQWLLGTAEKEMCRVTTFSAFYKTPSSGKRETHNKKINEQGRNWKSGRMPSCCESPEGDRGQTSQKRGSEVCDELKPDPNCAYLLPAPIQWLRWWLEIGTLQKCLHHRNQKVLQSQAFFDLEIQMLNIYQHTAGMDKWQYAWQGEWEAPLAEGAA